MKFKEKNQRELEEYEKKNENYALRVNKHLIKIKIDLFLCFG